MVHTGNFGTPSETKVCRIPGQNQGEAHSWQSHKQLVVENICVQHQGNLAQDRHITGTIKGARFLYT